MCKHCGNGVSIWAKLLIVISSTGCPPTCKMLIQGNYKDLESRGHLCCSVLSTVRTLLKGQRLCGATHPAKHTRFFALETKMPNCLLVSQGDNPVKSRMVGRYALAITY